VNKRRGGVLLLWVQWKRLAFSKGPTRVGPLTFFYSRDEGERSSLWNVQNINIHQLLHYLVQVVAGNWAGYLNQYSVWLRALQSGSRGSIPGRGERIFPVASVSRPALESIQPPVQLVPGVLSPGLERPERDAEHSPHLVPRSRMSRSFSPLPTRASVACSGTALAFSGGKLHSIQTIIERVCVSEDYEHSCYYKHCEYS
jgi:hypothetical protein